MPILLVTCGAVALKNFVKPPPAHGIVRLCTYPGTTIYVTAEDFPGHDLLKRIGPGDEVSYPGVIRAKVMFEDIDTGLMPPPVRDYALDSLFLLTVLKSTEPYRGSRRSFARIDIPNTVPGPYSILVTFETSNALVYGIISVDPEVEAVDALSLEPGILGDEEPPAVGGKTGSEDPSACAKPGSEDPVV